MSTSLALPAARAVDLRYHHLARLARRQHGVISIAQLVEIGFSRSAVKRAVTRGLLHRVHPSVLAVGHINNSRLTAFMGGVLAGGPGAVLGFRSTAELLRVCLPSGQWPEIVVQRGHDSVSRLVFHRTRSLFDDEVTEWLHVPCTTMERTLVDLSIGMDVPHLVRCITEASVQYPRLYPGASLDLTLIARIARRQRNRTGFALRTVMEALEMVNGGSVGLRSESEARMVEIVDGLGDPLICTKLPDLRVDGRLVEPDLRWVEAMLIVEVDGPIHLLPIRREYDERRDAVLRAAGFRVLRFTTDEVWNESARVRVAVERALAPS